MLLSTLVVGCLGVFLTMTLTENIERRAQVAAQRTAQAISVAGVEEHVSPRHLQVMTPEDLDQMTRCCAPSACARRGCGD